MAWMYSCEVCRIGDGSLLTRVQQLFEGHDDLLQKFMQFLPQEGIYNYGMDFGQRMMNPMGVYPYAVVHEYIWILFITCVVNIKNSKTLRLNTLQRFKSVLKIVESMPTNSL